MDNDQKTAPYSPLVNRDVRQANTKVPFWKSKRRLYTFMIGAAMIIFYGLSLLYTTFIANTWTQTEILSRQASQAQISCDRSSQPYIFAYQVNSKDYSLTTCVGSPNNATAIFYNPNNPQQASLSTPSDMIILAVVLLPLGIILALGGVFLSDPEYDQMGRDGVKKL